MADTIESLRRVLREEIAVLPVVDTHEHLWPESMRLERHTDFFTLVMTHYASSDLVSSGMPVVQMEMLRDSNVPFADKIPIFMPFWEKSSNTTYCRAIKIAVRDLYGIETIDAETLLEINKCFLAKNKPGIYKELLEDKCNIRYCVWDQFYLERPEKDHFFRLALRMDNIVFINSADDIRGLERHFNMAISSLDSLEEIMEIRITNHKASGLTAVKSGLAYQRTLDFEPVSKAEAVLALDKVLRNRFVETDVKVVQDYLMYSLAQKCYWHNLPMQIHTGLMEGNGNFIAHGNPAHLSSLIKRNPNTRFDLFHGGYPYGGEMSAMAKMFPNVYVDMAWLSIISPEYTRRYLSEWLETVPVNKIMGFGGDYCFAEGVYGHLQIAKENIARVLAEKVVDGIFTLYEARRYAAMMLYENPDSLFQTAQ